MWRGFRCRECRASWWGTTSGSRGGSRICSSTGRVSDLDLVHGARGGAGVECGGGFAAGSAGHRGGAQPADRVGDHESAVRPAGSPIWIWYRAHVEAPGLNVAGVSLPGVPGIVVGHNQRIAWGITNLQFDVQDLYIEKFDDRTGRYLYRGKVEQARPEREIIRIKGQPPTEIVVWVTRHGPLFRSEERRVGKECR